MTLRKSLEIIFSKCLSLDLKAHCLESVREAVTNHVISYLGGDINTKLSSEDVMNVCFDCTIETVGYTESIQLCEKEKNGVLFLIRSSVNR